MPVFLCGGRNCTHHKSHILHRLGDDNTDRGGDGNGGGGDGVGGYCGGSGSSKLCLLLLYVQVLAVYILFTATANIRKFNTIWDFCCCCSSRLDCNCFKLRNALKCFILVGFFICCVFFCYYNKLGN